MTKTTAQYTILFDGECGICRKFIGWLDARKPELNLRCVAQQDAPQDPTLAEIPLHQNDAGRPSEVVLLDLEGTVLRDTDAYLRLLDLIPETRALAKQLARPALRPFVRRAAHAVVNNRDTLSRLLGLSADQPLQTSIEKLPEPMRCIDTDPPA